MTKRLLLACLAATTLVSTGCLFSRKPRPPKENPAIASEVQAVFRQRWIARRIGELGGQGITGIAAREQATREFNEKFNFPEPKK